MSDRKSAVIPGLQRISARPRPLWLEEKCIHCGACVSESEAGGISLREDGGILLHPECSEDWAVIFDICPTGALLWDSRCPASSEFK